MTKHDNKPKKTNAVSGLQAGTRPNDANSWRKLALQKLPTHLHEAVEALEQALALEPADTTTKELLADTHYKLGNVNEAARHIEEVLTFKPASPHALLLKAHLQLSSGDYKNALQSISLADSAAPKNLEIQSAKANILYRNNLLDDAEALFETLTKANPKSYILLNNLGNVKRDIGKFQEAHTLYERAIKNSNGNTAPFSNLITTLHYRPEATPEEIFSYSKKWEDYFSKTRASSRPQPKNLSKNKKLRVGMFSDGFRRHPVGWMIVTALENIPKHEVEFYLYTTNSIVDQVTVRFQRSASKWENITHLNDEKFAEKIRDDEIDILIDLSGHNMGNRMRTMVLEPAPILVKWVGGLINTTGLKSIDYLISDHIETPEGVDHLYTEKLIRLPDDYVCYTPPDYLPEASEQLPALNNGYVTLGCFNNPIKTNDVVLENWAAILHKLPDSKIFLKGHQYSSVYLKDLINQKLVALGIPEERIRIEGPSSHDELLAAYNEVDIALDPWPYSGGLTTCEAMIMGVPVVSLPGPTFAGRHSATHLVNAQMPELVVSSWQEYQERVLELASDLESLKTIRTHLRQIILESNLCNAPHFARNFSNAMRAIWQRYCDGKAPSALNLGKGGNAVFVGEEALELCHPESSASEEFSFQLKGKLTAVVQNCDFAQSREFTTLLQTGAITCVCFDPATQISDRNLLEKKYKDFHHVPAKALGNGESKKLYIRMNPRLTGTITLENLDTFNKSLDSILGLKEITSLPIQSYALRSIEGLDIIDLLVLDNLNENREIINQIASIDQKNQPLLIQIRVNLKASSNTDNDIGKIISLLENAGYYLYKTLKSQRLDNKFNFTEAPDLNSIEISRDALFIPNTNHLASLSEDRITKLGFLLDGLYGFKYETYQLLGKIDKDSAEKYAVSSKIIAPPLAKKTSFVPQIKKSMEPEICVGIPCFNEEEFIEETIKSLMQQSYENVRFIISDNASTDKTVEIISDFIKNDKRFTLIQQEKNIGALENFKFVFDQATSEYFMWMGAHDKISENYFSECFSLMQSSPDVSMVIGMPQALINDHDKGVVKAAIYNFDETNKVNRYINSVMQLANCTVIHSIFNRNFLTNFEFEKIPSWDHIVISRLLWFGKLAYANKACYSRRYFLERSTSSNERLFGEPAQSNRSGFYRSYEKDFEKLATEDKLSRKAIEKHKETIDKVLKTRFNAISLNNHLQPR